MNDDYLGHDWADNHAKASDGIAAFFAAIGEGLARLHAIQFDAPWKQYASTCR